MSIETIMHELKKHRDDQKVKWAYSYTVSGLVRNGNTQALTLAIGQDAYFRCETITGKCFGPVDANGVWVGLTTTLTPQSNFPVFGDSRFAQSGISFKLTDQGAGTELINDYLNAELQLTPAYGLNFLQPFKFNYTFRPSSIVRFDVRNRDTAQAFVTATPTTKVDEYHYVSFALNGYKYQANIMEG
jgi:hypothetical protein